jgi:hypothetical protein
MQEQFGYRPVTLGDESRIFEVITTRDPDYGHIADAENRSRRDGMPARSTIMRWLKAREDFAERSSNSHSP